jgi:hypothetical protein
MLYYNNKVNLPSGGGKVTARALRQGTGHCSIGTAPAEIDRRLTTFLPSTGAEFIPLSPPHLDPPPSAALDVGML